MGRYVLRRVLQGVLILFGISLLVFFLVRLTGDPRALLLPMDASEEHYREVGKALGLDKPVPVQYFVFISRAVRGDFGDSIRAKRPVIELISQRLPNSAKLVAVASGLAFVIAFPLGVIAAVKRKSGIDTVAQVIAVLGQATPSFWLGILLIHLFAVQLHWLPPFGMGGIEHYVLPGFTMAWIATAGLTRLLRSGMLEALDSEFVKFARIKGVSESLVIWKHALRNALIPVVTFAGFYFATLISMAIVTETVFAWPGVGRLSYEALRWRDFPVIQGVMLVATAIVVVVNLAVDILYAYLDPRIRY